MIGSGKGWSRGLVPLLVIAGLVRAVGLLGPGHSGDLFAFDTWAEDAARHGLGGYYAAGGDSNYPPMLYLLWPLGVALNGGVLEWVIRTLSIPFDLALGALLFVIARDATGRERDGGLSAGFYLLNPAVVLTGPMWGQVDGMGALPMVGALVAVARGRVVSAGVLAVLAGLVKPQFGVAAFVLAGLVLFWLRSRDGIRNAALLALAGLATFVVVLAPLGLGPLGYLDLMGETFGRYPVHSGFAFNPWGMVFGFNRPDGDWFRVGTVLELAAIGGSLWLLRCRRDLLGLLAVGSLVALTLYFVPTRAHERYLYGAIALLAPLAVLVPRLRVPFYALSATFLVTLAYVVANSPYRILSPTRLADFPGWAISLMSLITTLSGAWMAWRLVAFLRESRPGPAEPNGTPEAGASAAASGAASG
jgi:dolichyl-phosphate-mannose-protein mannosyltransferase